jgi:hypothetical protein
MCCKSAGAGGFPDSDETYRLHEGGKTTQAEKPLASSGFSVIASDASISPVRVSISEEKKKR